MKCSICGHKISHPMIKDYFGNNPYPVRTDVDARCCDVCNGLYVIPLRLLLLSYDYEKQAELADLFNKANTDVLDATINAFA